MIKGKGHLSLVEDFSNVNLKKGLTKRSLVFLGWNLPKIAVVIHHLRPVLTPIKPIAESWISGGNSYMQQPGPV